MHDGLPVYKYIFKNDTLDNGANNPENKCFCRKNKCLKSGLIDVTDCYYGKTINIIKYLLKILLHLPIQVMRITDIISVKNVCIFLILGFPIVLSYPHFYLADQSLIDAVEGLHPDQNIHETYFLINPVR